MRTRLGAPKAITATANKIAKLFYQVLKEKRAYKDVGSEYYETRYKNRIVNRMKSKAQKLGYKLTPLCQNNTDLGFVS